MTYIVRTMDTRTFVTTTTTNNNTEGPTMPEHDPFTIQHCATWCESVGIGSEWVPALVQALADDGPDSTLSWPSVARYVGATYTDGIEYR